MIGEESIKTECSGLWLLIVKLQQRLDADSEEWHKNNKDT